MDGCRRRRRGWFFRSGGGGGRGGFDDSERSLRGRCGMQFGEGLSGAIEGVKVDG